MGLELTLGSLIFLVLMVWAILSTAQSQASTGRKILWIVLILFFPIFGFIVWLLLVPKRGTA